MCGILGRVCRSRKAPITLAVFKNFEGDNFLRFFVFNYVSSSFCFRVFFFFPPQSKPFNVEVGNTMRTCASVCAILSVFSMLCLTAFAALLFNHSKTFEIPTEFKTRAGHSCVVAGFLYLLSGIFSVVYLRRAPTAPGKTIKLFSLLR